MNDKDNRQLAVGPPAYDRPRNFSRFVIGLAIIAVGVIFTLDNFYIIRARSYLAYWPLVVVVLGVAHMLEAGHWGGRIWGLLIAFVGAWLLGENLGYIYIDIWELSPLLLVVLGLSIMLRSRSPRAISHDDSRWRGMRPPDGAANAATGNAGPQASARSGGDANGFIRGTAILSGFDSASDSTDFRGADLVSIMGGCKVDLRRASITGPEAVVDVLAVMGGIELIVPENWFVDMRVLPMLGGAANRTRVPQAGAQRLIVKGTAVFGGIEIKN